MKELKSSTWTCRSGKHGHMGDKWRRGGKGIALTGNGHPAAKTEQPNNLQVAGNTDKGGRGGDSGAASDSLPN